MRTIILNLAEALNRVKHEGEHLKNNSEYRALRKLAYSEYRIWGAFRDTKSNFGRELVRSNEELLNLWAYYSYKELPVKILDVEVNTSLIGKEVPRVSLSSTVDNLLERNVSPYEVYEELVKTVWDVERKNGSDSSKKYLDFINGLRGKFGNLI